MYAFPRLTSLGIEKYHAHWVVVIDGAETEIGCSACQEFCFVCAFQYHWTMWASQGRSNRGVDLNSSFILRAREYVVPKPECNHYLSNLRSDFFVELYTKALRHSATRRRIRFQFAKEILKSRGNHCRNGPCVASQFRVKYKYEVKHCFHALPLEKAVLLEDRTATEFSYQS